MASPRFPLFVFAGLLAIVVSATSAGPRIASAAPTPLASGELLLQKIRLVFRSHRPPPPYVTYTLVRKEDTPEGEPDYANSYTEHIWCRTSDRAALVRRVYRDEDRGPLTFDRPAYNEPRDPGPPTADAFERAPLKQHPNPHDFVPTPEPTGPELETLAAIRATAELSYHVTNVVTEGHLLHLSVVPIRDVERNRLREIYVNAKTLELVRFVSTDRLYLPDNTSYAATFTSNLQMLQGRPVITRIHGVIDDGYTGNPTTDYWFNDIRFPKSLPGWYFDDHQYAQHIDDAPI